MKLIVGVDEAGRGPLAGPVSVGIFAADNKHKRYLLKNIFDNKLRDSKKLSPEKREIIYKKLLDLKKEGKIYFFVCHVSNKIIDKRGISFAISFAIASNFKKLQHTFHIKHSVSHIRLDGLLKAPAEFKNQKTVIKGDEKDLWIACASIVAKVERDALMHRLAKKFPAYKLEIHKGYGTALHRSLISKHGLSLLHRQTFCRNLQNR